MPETVRARHREKALRAAYFLFKEHGINGVTQGMIAAESGLSLPSINRYFADRTALVQGTAEWAYRHVSAVVDLEKILPQNKTGREQLRLYMQAIAGLQHRDPDVFILRTEYELFVHRSKMDIQQCSMDAYASLGTGRRLEQIFSLGREDGTMHFSGDTARQVRAFCDQFFGFLSCMAMQRGTGNGDCKACIELYIGRILLSYEKGIPIC